MLPVSGHTQGSFIALSQAPQQAVMSSPVITAVSANEVRNIDINYRLAPNFVVKYFHDFREFTEITKIFVTKTFLQHP